MLRRPLTATHPHGTGDGGEGSKMWATRSLPEEKSLWGLRWALSESFVRAREPIASVQPVSLFLTWGPRGLSLPGKGETTAAAELKPKSRLIRASPASLKPLHLSNLSVSQIRAHVNITGKVCEDTRGPTRSFRVSRTEVEPRICLFLSFSDATEAAERGEKCQGVRVGGRVGEGGRRRREERTPGAWEVFLGADLGSLSGQA